MYFQKVSLQCVFHFRKNFQDSVAQSPWTRVSRFMATTQTIVEFAEGRAPRPTDKVLHGIFDSDSFYCTFLASFSITSHLFI